MKPVSEVIHNETAVAIFLTKHVKKCKDRGKSSREIAAEVGYKNANNITMIKQGLSKVPLEKAPALAKALDVNPAEFVQLCITEYFPGVYSAMSETMPIPRNPLEASLFDLIRKELDISNVKKTAPNTKLNEGVKELIRSL